MKIWEAFRLKLPIKAKIYHVKAASWRRSSKGQWEDHHENHVEVLARSLRFLLESCWKGQE